MLRSEGGRVRGGWALLVGVVLVMGCGAGTSDQAPGDVDAGVTSTAGVPGETATAAGAQDAARCHYTGVGLLVG